MEKIKKLKRNFIKSKIDGYIISKNDEFFGEYLPTYNDRLKYISDFTGSYGFSIILNNKNYLFVDGRYTLQAKKQSRNFFNIITIPNQMPRNVLKKTNYVIGYDPRLLTQRFLKIFFNNKKFILKPVEGNLIDKIWKRKSKDENKRFYALPKNSVGEDYIKKINRVTENLKNKDADFQFISSSENNAWLFNIRGEDSKYSPIPHCYGLIEKNKKIKLFCNLKKVSLSLRKKINKVEFIDINNIDKILSKIKEKKFIIDEHSCSIHFEKIIKKNNIILNCKDPIYYLKAIKNSKEIKNLKSAHICDGSALTK